MKTTTVGIATILLVGAFCFSSCSTNNTSSSNTSGSPTGQEDGKFNKYNLMPGQRYTWKGTVTRPKYGYVLVATEQDGSGNKTEYEVKLESITLPAEGTEITFDGVLDPKISTLTGTDYNYRPDGSRTTTTTTTKQLLLTDCHIH